MRCQEVDLLLNYYDIQEFKLVQPSHKLARSVYEKLNLLSFRNSFRPRIMDDNLKIVTIPTMINTEHSEIKLSDTTISIESISEEGNPVWYYSIDLIATINQDTKKILLISFFEQAFKGSYYTIQLLLLEEKNGFYQATPVVDLLYPNNENS